MASGPWDQDFFQKQFIGVNYPAQDLRNAAMNYLPQSQLMNSSQMQNLNALAATRRVVNKPAPKVPRICAYCRSTATERRCENCGAPV